MELLESFKRKAQEIAEVIVSHRRHLHINPELSFQEHNTANYIQDILTALGIPFKSGVAGTGIVAEIKTGRPGKLVALRADMDALPITEKDGRAYGSRNPGVMHACGHDVHLSALLGAAMILNEFKEKLSGDFRLIFQPGEELLPGGASLMIKEGVLDGVSCIVGQHVYPSMETGRLGFREGMYMASTDELHIKVAGKAGHAAMPADYKNPIIALSDLILSLTDKFMGENKVVPKDVPTVLAIGKVQADGATNVIPAAAFAEGTFRTMNEKWRAEAHELILAEAKRISSKSGTNCEVEIRKGYPFLVNEPSTTQKSRQAAEEFLGKEKVEELPIRMTAEDFAWYTQEVPGCFYRLGTGNKEKGITSGVHTPDFDIDENALPIGAGVMAYIAATLASG